MECAAEIDGNEINLAQIWSLFCLWEFETSLQSFKFPCNSEIKEISNVSISLADGHHYLPVALQTRAANVNDCIWNEYIIGP